MPQLISVRFRFNPKALWFDPQGTTYTAGTEVLVETERGREVGTVVDPNIEASDKDIAKLKTPLKPVIRELTDLDYEHIEALDEKGRNAMPFFREKVEEYELDIKPVEVQYLFSGERAVFFFSSEERVDFRELVRDLAQHFHVRIDMRQIGARDEAKELGGIAHCGEEFCCTRFGGEFQPVSIRMAKEQDLPLNPSKISGVCGRLMCCLRYEYETYKDFKKRAPKKGTPVDTPLGDAVISGYNTPGETMEIKLGDGKRLTIPLAEMECHKGSDGCQRCSVNNETIERCASKSMLMALGALDLQLEDALSSQEEIDINLTDDGTQGGRKRRRRSSKKAGDTEQSKEQSKDQPKEQSKKGQSQRGQSQRGQSQKNQQQRGQNQKSRAQRGQAQGDQAQRQGSSDQNEPRSDGARRRRRRTTSGATGGTGATDATGTTSVQNAPSVARGTGGSSTNNTTQQRSQNKGARTSNGASSDKPRPGQNSSGLRKRRSHSGSNKGSNNSNSSNDSAGSNNRNEG